VKGPVWWPTAPTAAGREAYDKAGIPQSYGRGTTVLKAPVGDEAYAQEVLDDVCRKATKSLDVLADMDDALIALACCRRALACTASRMLYELCPPASRESLPRTTTASHGGRSRLISACPCWLPSGMRSRCP
jgi:hypothetical protein